jgi:hypothetical protein
MTTFKYISPTYKNCSPSAAQQGALASDTAWAKTLKTTYSTVFGAGSAIFNSLQGGLYKMATTIQGIAAPALAAMNSQIINRAVAAGKDLNQVIGINAAKSGATPGVESGVTQAARAEGEAQILGTMGNQQANLEIQNYELGVKNQQFATEAMEKLPSVFEPSTQAAQTENAALTQEGTQAQANAAASSSWMGLVGGLADSTVQALGEAAGGKHK